MGVSRRGFLMAAGGACFAQGTGKGRVSPSAITRYLDPSTEFPVLRLTDPTHTSRLPASYERALSRRRNFLLYASDLSGRFEAYEMDLKSGQSRQLTEAEDLDPGSLTLLADDRGFCYLDGQRLMTASLSNLRPRELYRMAEGFERGPGFSIAEDGQYAALVEKRGAQHRLQLVHLVNGAAQTLADCGEEIRDPIPRPRRASVLYRCGETVWLANYDAQQNYPLHLADGKIGPAQWSPDGRAVLYLNYPEDSHRLHNLREFTPDANADKMLANTTQFVQFACNPDASVFVGASGSKASPFVLLLVRAVKRELTLAEHRASDPQMVAPIFAPNSQRIYFSSDQHGKPAIYAMAIEKLVEETDEY
jgi:oligogalacturonide lyase